MSSGEIALPRNEGSRQRGDPSELLKQRFKSSRPFGDYELLGQIARGGMAEVYFAVRAAEPREVLAIKCMRGKLADEPRFIEMFVREGRLATLFDHPCIVRSLDVGNVEGRYYIAMLYIPGQDLTAVLRRCRQTGRRLPVPHALHVALAICRALDYAHELTTPEGRPLNIVNRDVSPSNVRLSYDGAVKLIDFGIAQAVVQVTSEIGLLKGKFAYMSPEQIRGLPVDRRTDIFSTGIVLHEMLTCERLFREESEFSLMEKVRQTEITPPSAYNKRVPADVDAVVLRALSRDPAERYASAAEMAVALEPLLERYQFVPAELGEFVRSLFPEDHRRDRELLNALVADAEDGAAERSARGKRRRPKRKRRRRTGSSASPPRIVEQPQSSRALLIAAGALLLAAALITILALR